jgi:metal-responsive CopG/Arc/MetJ family transcriptional regulator
MTGVRIPADLAERLSAWIDRQPDPKPSRAEAIRRLIERGLRDAD